MEMERTLAIIKPDAVAAGVIGEVIRRIEGEGLTVAAMRLARLSERETEGFYYVHRQRPFFGSLVKFMTSGPCVLLVLRGTDAVVRWRNLMGSTDPSKAEPGTLRSLFGTNIERNAVHGSDSEDSASFEVNYFFKGTEIVG
ncbi:MAG: nucleoside-diphosphate kinase [Ignavibacteriales bacterium CG07_land_8_20_14_0_80_59_12]|nr:MAG: nucleoside-diphosphate kinase [Ignavibacteriales bacterium CG07_land_8_20_14_0_80_59_12]